jgi:energy-converting hydrogenase Eha subunit F
VPSSGWKTLLWCGVTATWSELLARHRIVTAFRSVNMQMLMLIQFSVSITASLPQQHFGRPQPQVTAKMAIATAIGK